MNDFEIIRIPKFKIVSIPAPNLCYQCQSPNIIGVMVVTDAEILNRERPKHSPLDSEVGIYVECAVCYHRWREL